MAEPDQLTTLLLGQLPEALPQAAIYEPARREVRLYKHRITGDALSNPSRRSRPSKVIRLDGWPAFDEVRRILRRLMPGIQVWNGSLPDLFQATFCPLCRELYGHHEHCPTTGGPLAMAEYWQGFHRGRTGEVAVTLVTSSFSLGVFQGQHDRRQAALA